MRNRCLNQNFDNFGHAEVEVASMYWYILVFEFSKPHIPHHSFASKNIGHPFVESACNCTVWPNHGRYKCREDIYISIISRQRGGKPAVSFFTFKDMEHAQTGEICWFNLETDLKPL
jgi:hypothetical protein